MKYEWDEETNMLKLDRVLHGAAFYPHDYGFIPQTLCGDGDPLVRRTKMFDRRRQGRKGVGFGSWSCGTYIDSLEIIQR